VRRLGAAVLAVLAAAIPASALAQGITIFEIGGGGGRTLSAVQATLRVTGALTVDFHGDEASGCAAARLCGVSGTVTWSPAGPATLLASGFRSHGKRYESAYLILGDESDSAHAPRTSARVRRLAAGDAAAGVCADVASQALSALGTAPRRGRAVEVRMVGLPADAGASSEALRTRCAGPMSSDVGALLPSHLISERALLHGHRNLDYSAERPFAAHGLAGTLRSTLVLHVVGGQDVLADQTGQPPGRTRIRRTRYLDLTYRIERVSGQVVTGVSGLADPDLCGPFDACGLLGSVTVAPSASSGGALLEATASARHSRLDLRRAVGLAPGRRAKGISTFGYVSWSRDRGAVTSDLSRGGAPGCLDSEPLAGGGAVTLSFTRSGVHVRYGESGNSLGEPDPLRTRCPGPGIGDVTGGGALATGTVPLRAFRGNRVTLRLTRGAAYRSDGYSGRSRSDVTVVLRRTRVAERVRVEHVPVGFSRVLARRLR
jgi:hypothetical protein